MKRILLSDIRIDGGTQPRAEIAQLVVDDYAESMRAGQQFPPVTLFHDGVAYWLADGFHRFHATRAAGLDKIDAKVEQGTQRDAILFSLSANTAHGLRRTNADKRRAVGILLADKEWSKRSDRWVAEKCAVGHAFVSSLRPQVSTVDTSPRAARDGKTYPATQPVRPTPPAPPRPPPQIAPAVRDVIRPTREAQDCRSCWLPGSGGTA